MSATLGKIAAEDSLGAAWERVRRGGPAPGLDGVTLEDFAYRAAWELPRLRRELLDGTYRPWPARRVALPKLDGGRRLLGIQAVRDRVVQRAFLHELQPRVEPTLEDACHAYRPRRGIETALADLEGFRQEGREWVVRADVELCFDSLDRPRLLRRVAAVLPDARLLSLAQAWLAAGVVDEAGWHDPGKGVCQGDVLSPLLCNLYLDPFDEAMAAAGYSLVRYADDFTLAARSRDAALAGLKHAQGTLSTLGLRLNEKKGWVGTFAQGFEFLGAGIVGPLRLPLHRQKLPGRPPSYHFGYGESSPSAAERRREAASPVPLARTQREVTALFKGLLRTHRAGKPLTTMALAFLEDWRPAEAAPPSQEHATWQSLYLI